MESKYEVKDEPHQLEKYLDYKHTLEVPVKIKEEPLEEISIKQELQQYQNKVKEESEIHITDYNIEENHSVSRTLVIRLERCDNLINTKTNNINKQFNCTQCGYKTDNKKNLAKHQLIHSDLKPFACDQCKYKCRRKSQLKIHKISHSGEKPFQCDLCEYKCDRMFSLQRHQFVHTGEKPFSCNRCEYRCSQKIYLKIHESNHSTVKPFKCDECNSSFHYESSLKTHQFDHMLNIYLKNTSVERSNKTRYLDFKKCLKENFKKRILSNAIPKKALTVIDKSQLNPKEHKEGPIESIKIKMKL